MFTVKKKKKGHRKDSVLELDTLCEFKPVATQTGYTALSYSVYSLHSPQFSVLCFVF